MEQYLQSLVQEVRQTSPYYTELYRQLPENVSLDMLPLVQHAEFWACSNRDRREVMTGPQIDGVIMKTGGTTARPKTTAYSQIELQRTTQHLANGLLAAGIRPGDRIGNMFYAGDLYGSFLLHVLSIMELPIPAVHVPIGGLTSIESAASLIEQCGVTALLSTATSLVKLSAHLNGLKQTITTVRCVMFGGELLFPEQEKVIRIAFPQATIRSCIYGSVDAGVVAAAAPGNDTRVHRAFTESVIVEIVRNDGSARVIVEPREPGLLVVTNFNRRLAPVIRYPTGDLAAWVDKDAGIFKLLGRASQAVRLGPVSIDVADVRAIVTKVLDQEKTAVHGVQAVLTRNGGVDQMECVVAAQVEECARVAGVIVAELDHQRPMFKQHVDMGLVAPLVVRFVTVEELQLTPGSHKLMDVVEKRL